MSPIRIADVRYYSTNGHGLPRLVGKPEQKSGRDDTAFLKLVPLQMAQAVTALRLQRSSWEVALL